MLQNISELFTVSVDGLTGRRRGQWPGVGFRLVEFHVGSVTKDSVSISGRLVGHCGLEC